MRLYCSLKYRLVLLMVALSQFALADPTTGSGGIGG
jgi:hypothetical protein